MSSLPRAGKACVRAFVDAIFPGDKLATTHNWTNSFVAGTLLLRKTVIHSPWIPSSVRARLRVWTRAEKIPLTAERPVEALETDTLRDGESTRSFVVCHWSEMIFLSAAWRRSPSSRARINARLTPRLFRTIYSSRWLAAE